MSLLSHIKPHLVDAYRLVTWPYRTLHLKKAVREKRVPIAILFYHRVADDHPNPWTIGTAVFKEQIDWLAANFDLVSLEEVQQRMLSGDNRRPAVSITFDDGYADNATFALPLLIKRKIPVTYFVTTENTIGQSPFSHDVDRGASLETNSLDMLRAFADSGIEIGAHTRTHADLGPITDSKRLFDEVITSAKELETQLDRCIRYFAFPFGQIENLNQEVFQLAKDHGFQGVCSAFGGWNEIGSDPFHLHRFHGDPSLATLKNWLTLDPRKRWSRHTETVNSMLQKLRVTSADGKKNKRSQVAVTGG